MDLAIILTNVNKLLQKYNFKRFQHFLYFTNCSKTGLVTTNNVFHIFRLDGTLQRYVLRGVKTSIKTNLLSNRRHLTNDNGDMKF